MAKLFGKEKKSYTRNLFVGVGKIVPVAFNPTKEELAIATDGQKTFEKDIVYKYVDAKGADSYKFDVWCRLDYVEGEDGRLVQPDDTTDATTEYVCYSWWGSKQPEIFLNEDGTVKGAWYVNTITCGMEWVPENNLEAYKTSRKGKTRLDYDNPKTHLALGGEKELLTFLETWLRIEEIDFATPFEAVLRGNYAEIKQVIKDNLNRTDRTPRGFKVMFGVKQTGDNSYQSIYPYLIYHEDMSNYNRLDDALTKREWKDDRSNKDYTLRYYKEEMPSVNKTTSGSAPTVIQRPTPTSSGW